MGSKMIKTSNSRCFFSSKIIEPSILGHVKPIDRWSSQLETSIYTGLSRFLWGFLRSWGICQSQVFSHLKRFFQDLDARGYPHDWYRKPFKNREFWQMVGTSSSKSWPWLSIETYWNNHAGLGDPSELLNPQNVTLQ
jgi:hypothetical protein